MHLHFYSRFHGWETGLVLARGGLFEWTRVEDRTPCVKGAGVTRVWLYDDGFGAWLDDCVCDWWCLRKRERARAKLRTSSFAHLCVPKVYFDFAICPFSLYVIVGVEHI